MERVYTVDEDTQELLEIVLTWAQELVDLQKEEESRADMQTILVELADRFQIKQNTITIDETEDENGDIHLKIRVEEVKEKPKLSVVDGDNIVPFNKLTDDDDGGTRH